ncbi:MAG: hypothetical protein IKZ87_01010 [Actinomycetaceae bacterium]|nr:hypothetical protein [Actinomycetaceae bacterium]
MTSRDDFSDKDIANAWKSIEEDLSDITPPATSFPNGPSSSDFLASTPQSNIENPRNWSAPNDDIVEELLAEDDDFSYREVSEKDLIVQRPHIAFAWVVSMVAILLGLGISTSFLPGSGSFGLILLIIGFFAAAIAAYLTARRNWEDNPYDDGSRV